jgi:hypothetical protein
MVDRKLPCCSCWQGARESKPAVMVNCEMEDRFIYKMRLSPVITWMTKMRKDGEDEKRQRRG